MNCPLETGANTFKWNALHDGIEKSLHHQAFRLLTWNATRRQVKKRFLFKFSHRGAVGAAYVVCKNFETRDGVCARLRAQDEIAVRLVTIRFCASGAT